MKEVKMSFEAGVDGTASAEPSTTGASSGGSPTPQSGAATPAATPSGATGASAAERTYRDEDVQRIVRERLADEQRKFAPYRELGDASEVRARLERLERMERAARGDVPQQPSAEQRELRELLTKEFPGIDKFKDLEARLEARERQEHAARAQAGRGSIAKLAQEKLGTSDPEALELLETAISASIAKDKESLDAWNQGDVSVVDRHFEAVLSKKFDPLFKSASARYTSGKAKDKAEVPPSMPKGGVQAPASQDRKMSMDERKEAAYKRYMESSGQA
jgi:hypothetical protein